jgi:hypothetical protein
MPNVAQIVYPTGQSIAPESLAPLPSPLEPGTYFLTFVVDPDSGTSPIYINKWVLGSAGGEPVTGTGWGFNFGGSWGGGS